MDLSLGSLRPIVAVLHAQLAALAPSKDFFFFENSLYILAKSSCFADDFNVVVFKPDRLAEGQLDELLSLFDRKPFVCYLEASRQAPLAAQLQAKGFLYCAAPSAMLITSNALQPPSIDGPFSFCIATQIEPLRRWSACLAQIFDPTEELFLAYAKALLAIPSACFLPLMVLHDDQVVAAMLLFCKGSLAYLSFLGVDLQWRKKGIARALSAYACQLAFQRGVATCSLLAAPAAEASYAAIGFAKEEPFLFLEYSSSPLRAP